MRQFWLQYQTETCFCSWYRLLRCVTCQWCAQHYWYNAIFRKIWLQSQIWPFWGVHSTNPLSRASGLVERTPKNGLIWLWSLILRKNCIKPLVLGTSLASHTPKLSVSTAETSFCLILEPQSPFFFQPPVWDKFNLQFGTQFISISMDFHSYLIISMGQNAVPIGPFLGVRSPASLSEWGGEPV